MADHEIEKAVRQAKKELCFWFAIVLLVILQIASWAWNYLGNKNVLDQLSLISSISSILLALVAIWFAVIQNSDTTKQNFEVQVNLTKIGEQINHFVTIREEFNDFKSLFIDTMDKFNGMIQQTASNNEEMKETLSRLQMLQPKVAEKDEMLAKEFSEQVNQVVKLVDEGSINSKYFSNYLKTLDVFQNDTSCSDSKVLKKLDYDLVVEPIEGRIAKDIELLIYEFFKNCNEFKLGNVQKVPKDQNRYIITFFVNLPIDNTIVDRVFNVKMSELLGNSFKIKRLKRTGRN